MKNLVIKKEDILNRIYFIINLVQNQKSDTLHGALTSKSDSMGGIFDRFINTVSDDIVCNRYLINKTDNIGKNIKFISDFYLYKPSKNIAGIAPDVFGISVNNKDVPFVEFENKWKPVEGMPQIEIKTFKAKDQMVSLRNQQYDNEYLIMCDLKLRIDYLVPFLDKNLFSAEILQNLYMNDAVFIKRDDKQRINRPREIDFSNNEIGSINVMTITTGKEFMTNSTECGPGISPRRIKEIKVRKGKVNNTENISLKHLSDYSYVNSKNGLTTFNTEWYKATGINNQTTRYLDFYCKDADNIFILKINKSSIVVWADSNDCVLNNLKLEFGKYYTIIFETLDRSGTTNPEYFMQKECVCHLKNLEEELVRELNKIIAQVDSK